MQIPVKIFIVYAHEDKPVRDKLLRQLRPLADTDEIDLWSDHEIKPGAVWDDEIRLRLAQSEIILLLVSDDFFASDYIRRVELHTALDLHTSGDTRLLPVIARHCGWADLPALSRLQVLPPGGRPVLSKEWDSPDEPYLKIYEGVKGAVRELRGRKEKTIPVSDAPAPASPSLLHFTRKWWLPASGLMLAILFLLIKCPFAENKLPENPSPEITSLDTSTLHKIISPSSPDSMLNKNGNSKIVADKRVKPSGRSNDPSGSVQPHTELSGDTITAVPPSFYDRKLETSEDMTRIIKGKKQSFLNSRGQWIGQWYDDAENFHNGMASVKLNGRRFKIDKTGHCVEDC